MSEKEKKQKALMMNFKALQRKINDPAFPKDDPVECLLYRWEIEGVVEALEEASFFEEIDSFKITKTVKTKDGILTKWIWCI